MEEIVTIPRRFRGPANSGNGGYSAGLLGSGLGRTVAVRLRRPPPLEAPLVRRVSADGAELHSADELVAEAVPASIDWALPEHVRLSWPDPDGEAVNAAHHPAPMCFVCGMDRLPGDGLRLLIKRRAGTDIFVATWAPDASLAKHEGAIASPIVWAALDCPGGWAAAVVGGRPDEFLALTRMTVQERSAVHPGERVSVVGWPIAADLERPEAGTAIIDQAGNVRASAHLVHARLPRSWVYGGFGR